MKAMKAMKAIVILAGGQQTRLAELTDSKCLLPIAGRPNLCRTLRLLEAMGQKMDHVLICGVTHCGCPEHAPFALNWDFPAGNRRRVAALADKGQSIEHAWQSAVLHLDATSMLVLLGDVVWQPAELQYILSGWERNTSYIHRKNKLTQKPYAEVLACVVDSRSIVDVAGVKMLHELRQRAFFSEHNLGGWSDDIDNSEDLATRYPLLQEMAEFEDPFFFSNHGGSP